MHNETAQLDKALVKLKEALDQTNNEFLTDSVIRRFNFCIDLAWKTSKKVMGTSSPAPKEVVREMAQNGYLSNIEVWLEAIDMRSISSYAYKEELANKIYAFAVSFYPYLKDLTQILK